jgi:hypothetical protein
MDVYYDSHGYQPAQQQCHFAGTMQAQWGDESNRGQDYTYDYATYAGGAFSPAASTCSSTSR